MTCDGLASRPGGVEILLAASCYGNRDKLQPDKPVGSMRLHVLRSHGTKSHMLVSKLHDGTSKTKAGQGGLVRVALFWKSHCATCSTACVILYHVTGSSNGLTKTLLIL